MSKIGKQAVRIPENIKIQQKFNLLLIKNNNIEKELEIPVGLNIILKEKNLYVVQTKKEANIIWGTFRKKLQNTVLGVSQGFQISLRLVGVGYRATKSFDEKQLILKLGFSHLINVDIPPYIQVHLIKTNNIIVRSHDLNSLMQYAALIRSYKKPEPYKGKGILYKGEKIRRKEGKKK